MAKKGLNDTEKKELTADTDGGLQQPESSGKKSNMLLIVVIMLALLGAVGGGLYATGKLPFGKTKVVAEKPAEEASPEGAAPAAETRDEHGNVVKGTSSQSGKGPIFYNFPDSAKFLVNLNTGGKQATFLKVDVALELPSSKDLEAVNANLPRIQDMFNTYLRELRPSDLQGSAGIYRLREELLLRVNKAVAPAKVSDVLFKEIVIQ